jgi:hypothetical protein
MTGIVTVQKPTVEADTNLTSAKLPSRDPEELKLPRYTLLTGLGAVSGSQERNPSSLDFGRLLQESIKNSQIG